MATMNKLRTQMAQQFLDALNQGKIPWKACWQQNRPSNAVNGKLYRGVNALYLSYWAEEKGYTDPRWCTYKQAQDNGWQVRKGEHSECKVEYWAYYDLLQHKLLSWTEATELVKADSEYIKNLQLRSRVYTVFNAAQIDGIPDLAHNNTRIGEIRAQRDSLIRNMGISYQEQGSSAFYRPSTDMVTLPPEVSFTDEYGYMATLLHECSHATGHPSRLNRDLSGFFGSDSYAKEELRAEIASAFTAQALGLQLSDEQLQGHMEQHMAYVQSWAADLEDAPDELFRAIKVAEGISDYLIEKGEFEQQLDSNKTMYVHIYYNDNYLFSVPEEDMDPDLNKLLEDPNSVGIWDSYISSELTAPASLSVPSTTKIIGYTPYTDALLQQHLESFRQSQEANLNTVKFDGEIDLDLEKTAPKSIKDRLAVACAEADRRQASTIQADKKLNHNFCL